ncbi:MAG TPA: undecaprenyl-diphosphate phosphatase [Actinomycetota bacterium]|jgi:undecaprenyl-diphosphatase|nr:undecaprenyl-diphosphate phosphatase [Actinomycetota bacterium]
MFRALVLGAVQGLTEFVPVSSSAHLVLVPFMLGWPIPGLAFDVAVHLGTALAVLVYFRRELGAIVVGAIRAASGRGDERDREMGRLAVLLAVASVPSGLAGLLLGDFFEELFKEPETVALLLLGTAALLFVGEAMYGRRPSGERRGLRGIGLGDALVVGLLQAVAITPGISRSGATISAGLVRGLSRDAAARFSFLLGLPAILGAGLVEVPDLPPGADTATILGAAAVAAVIGFLSIAFLLRYLRTRDTRPFAYYCVLFSALGLGYALLTD